MSQQTRKKKTDLHENAYVNEHGELVTPRKSVSLRTAPETVPQIERDYTPLRRTASLLASIIILVIGISFSSGYVLGKNNAPISVATPEDRPTLEVPKDATIIAQCAEGRGTQYVLPKDIPHGPVYNVWKNKIIGLEYMVGKDEFLGSNKDFLNLPLHGLSYDHINIGLLSQGHAGYPEPHYHVDIFTISSEEAAKITC